MRTNRFAARRCALRGGFTLLELMIVAGVLVILVTITILILVRSADAYEADTLATTLEGQARRVVEDIALELRQAVASTMVPSQPANSNILSFKQDLGYSGGAIQTGSLITYSGGPAPGDWNDGIDNNRNGLVDEWVVNRQSGAAGAVSITNFVREGGLAFNWDAATSTVVITLILERIDSHNRLVTRKVSTAVRLRN